MKKIHIIGPAELQAISRQGQVRFRAGGTAVAAALAHNAAAAAPARACFWVGQDPSAGLFPILLAELRGYRLESRLTHATTVLHTPEDSTIRMLGEFASCQGPSAALADDLEAQHVILGGIPLRGRELADAVKRAQTPGARVTLVLDETAHATWADVEAAAHEADSIVASARNLFDLTGEEDATAQIQWLRDRGVSGDIAVLDPPGAILVFHDGDWFYQPPFPVAEEHHDALPMADRLGIIAGVMTAWGSGFKERPFRDGVKYAAAALAMAMRSESPASDWYRLEKWIQRHPAALVHPPIATTSSAQNWRYATAAAVVIALGITLAATPFL